MGAFKQIDIDNKNKVAFTKGLARQINAIELRIMALLPCKRYVRTDSELTKINKQIARYQREIAELECLIDPANVYK